MPFVSTLRLMGEDVILVNIKSYIHPYFLSGYEISQYRKEFQHVMSFLTSTKYLYKSVIRVIEPY